VQLRLQARLLGVRLLVVDGSVILTPTEPVAPGRRPYADGSRLAASAERLDDVARRLAELRTC